MKSFINGVMVCYHFKPKIKQYVDIFFLNTKKNLDTVNEGYAVH